MIEPNKTGWPWSVRRLGSWLYSIGSALLVTTLIRGSNPTLRPGTILLIIGGFCVAFYFLWTWVFFERPAELDKKLPINSKELRRKRKEFFDSFLQ